MADVQEVRLSRAEQRFAPQLLVSALIEKTSERLSFDTYKAFVDFVMCRDAEAQARLEKLFGAAGVSGWRTGVYQSIKSKRALPYTDADAYRLLKVATEAFLAVNCAPVRPDSLDPKDADRLARVDATIPDDLRAEFDDYLEDIEVTVKETNVFPGKEAIEAIKRRIDDEDPNRYPKDVMKLLKDDLDRIYRSAQPTFDAALLAREVEHAIAGAKLPAQEYAPDIAALMGQPPAPGARFFARDVTRLPLLPYLALIQRKLPDVGIAPQMSPEEVALCYQIVQERLANPCFIELIWSYWHEQGMLVQTMNAISRRFQNMRGPNGNDPLAMLEIGYLRPINNLLWGYVQDEQHRLSLVRRTYEYDHHYGLTLEGTAVPRLRGADSRSKFLESFHNLLYLSAAFFRQDDDTTVKADGFPVLNALKDVHMLLSEGAHNQFGDLPSTARIEMLMQQWLLARPEFRELLPTRESVAYPEPWMERVDAMKRLQGWMDTSVMHFRDLGVFGEQLLLSIRFIEWSKIDESDAAVTWARLWRAKIQGYIYGYRAVTGVDLTASPGDAQQAALRVAQPSELLRLRLQSGAAVPALPAGIQTTPLPSFRERRAIRR